MTINHPYEKSRVSPGFKAEHALRLYVNEEEPCIACKILPVKFVK